MKLNRKWLLAIALVLSLTMAISGTLAYLTDRDTVENVFTMGNVDIEIEESFQQDSQLYPGVEVVKKAGITNTHATEPAYVWMVVSVPNDLKDHITLGWADGYSATTVTSPHAGYTGYLVKYPNALTAGNSTGNILESVMLNANVDYQNGSYVAMNNGVATPINVADQKIIVDGYAIQTTGFNGVEEAYTSYTTQWGGLNGGESGVTVEINAKTVTVNNQTELNDAIANATEDTIIILADSIEGDVTVPQSMNVNITIRGEGNTFSGSLLVDGKSAQEMTAGLTIENLHFTGETIPSDIDACIRLGNSGDSNTRYTTNVTVKNCTFTASGKVGIKSYTGGDKNLTIINCTTNAAAHSLVQIAGVDGVLIQDCDINAERGLNFNQSANIVIKNCEFDVKKYAVRFGASDGDMTNTESYLIEGCTIKSANVDNDAAIILRGTANLSTLNINNTTIDATSQIDNSAADAKVYVDGTLK